MRKQRPKMRTASLAAVIAVSSLMSASAAVGQSSDFDLSVESPDLGAFPVVRLFVNVTDGAGGSVEGLDASAFKVMEGDREIEILEVTQDAPGVGRLLNVVLAVDVSGSMQEPSGDPAIVAARNALVGFLDGVEALGSSEVAVSLVTFGSTVRDPVEGGFDTIRAAVGSVNASDAETRLYDAVRRSTAIAARDEQAARRVVIVLTDGVDEGSDSTLDELLGFLETREVEVVTVGVGSEPDADALGAIAAASDGRYFRYERPADLPAAYEALARDLPPTYYGLVFRLDGAADAERRLLVGVDLGRGESLSEEVSIVPPGADRASDRDIPWLVVLLVALGVLVVVLLVVVLASPGGRRRDDAGVAAPSPWLGPAFVVAGYRFPINLAEMSIGRDPTTDICIADPSVSRIHARVVMSREGLLIEDLNSSNGTFVNDEPIRAAYLTHGDVVTFGSAEVVFEGSVA